MGLYQESNPSRTANTGAACYWLASDNTIDFIYRREDYRITGVSSYSTGRTRFNLTGGGDFKVRVGEDIYIEDVVNKYTGTYTVITGGLNWFVGEVNYDGNTIGFAVDVSRWPNYYMDVDVYDARTGNSIGYVQFVPDSTGRIRVELSTLIQSRLNLNTFYRYELVNKREEDWNVSFKFRFYEVLFYDGSVYQLNGPTEEGNQYYVTKAAKQLQDEWGQNMRLFEIYPEGISNEAKFLDEGEVSTYFKGYPWSLSFIYGEQVTGVKYERHVEELDVNQDLIAGTAQQDYLAEVDQGYTNRLSLRKTGFNYGFTGMDADTHFLRIWINETDEVTDDDLGGGGSTGGGGTGSGVGGSDASLLADDCVGG